MIVLILGGVIAVLTFFGDYGLWTFGLLAFAVFGPQIGIDHWRERKKEREREAR